MYRHSISNASYMNICNKHNVHDIYNKPSHNINILIKYPHHPESIKLKKNQRSKCFSNDRGRPYQICMQKRGTSKNFSVTYMHDTPFVRTYLIHDKFWSTCMHVKKGGVHAENEWLKTHVDYSNGLFTLTGQKEIFDCLFSLWLIYINLSEFLCLKWVIE